MADAVVRWHGWTDGAPATAVGLRAARSTESTTRGVAIVNLERVALVEHTGSSASSAPGASGTPDAPRAAGAVSAIADAALVEVAEEIVLSAGTVEREFFLQALGRIFTANTWG
jgi:hypothetical protein